MWLDLCMVEMITGIDLSQEIFAINVMRTLNSLSSIVASMFSDPYNYMETRPKESFSSKCALF